MIDFENLIPPRPYHLVVKDMKAHKGNGEKVASAARPFIVIKGIEAHSRYAKLQELAVMAEWIWRLPPPIRPAISSVSCDSKAQWHFTITCRCGVAGQFEDWMGMIADALEAVCMEREGGHNGIYVNNPVGHELYILDPEWCGKGWENAR